MQTNFSLAQLADPATAEAEQILRTCVHCGFCTATCPTFLLLGDELDSPRGRIYLIKEMLEQDRPADAETVLHVDRCLSCLSCMTTCPSGVHYMHLVDHARAHSEETYERPLQDRLLRSLLTAVLPHRRRFRAALALAYPAKPLAPLLARLGLTGRRLAAMLRLAPAKAAPPTRLVPGAAVDAPANPKGRVALLTGCAQPGLRPEINEATVRLLRRLGIAVVLPKGEGCCGALVHHMGREEEALASARRNVDAWTAEIDRGGLDAILITASGCGTTIKDYGHMLKGDPAYAAKAARVSALARTSPSIWRRSLCHRSTHRPISWSPITPPARCSTASASANSRRRCCARRASRSATCPRAISAAGPREPTTSCSRTSPPACATENSPTSPRYDPM